MQGKLSDTFIGTHLWASLPHFARLFLPVACLIIAIAVLFDFVQADNKKYAFMQQEQLKLSHRVDMIHRTFNGLISDLIILSKHNDFQHIASAAPVSIKRHTEELAAEFRQFHIYRPYYDQVRFINAEGMEKIRSNYLNNGVELVEPLKLQNKSRRPYFINTMKLDRKQIYISGMELNQEHRRIQHPVKATVRLSMPMIAANGKKFGILVLNYRAAFLFNELASSGTSHEASEVMMLNQHGDWLHNDHNPSLEWGFMYSSRAEHLFSDLYPDAWHNISNASFGQYIGSSGMFTYTMVNPVDSFKHRLSSHIPGNLIYKTRPREYSWVLISHIPPASLTAILRPSTSTHIITVAALIFIWGLICLVLSRDRKVREKVQLELSEKDMQMHYIVDAAFNGIISINEQGIIESFNPAACRMFGYAEAETIGQNVAMITPEPHNSAHDSYIQRYITSGEAHIVGKPREVIAIRNDGSSLPVELFVSARQIGEHWQFIGILHDISERKAMEAKLTELATTDGLTGIHNRAYFNEQLHEEFIRAKRYQTHQLSLLLLDADHFKSVNDNHGHPAGDAVLIAIAEKAQACARETDIVARYGGEEFVIILPDTNGTDALKLGERLRRSIESMHVDYEGQTISRTVSIGIAYLQDKDLDDEDTLLSQADQALYQAKEGGRNQVALYKP